MSSNNILRVGLNLNAGKDERMKAIKRKTEASQGRHIEKHCQVVVKLL